MYAKRFNGLWIIVILLAAVLVGLVLWGASLLAEELSMPEDATAQKVWRYAKEHKIDFEEYPASLIELLEKNPETEQFVLEYPLAKDKTYSVDPSTISRESVPLFLQWDQRWGYLTYGNDPAGLTGCGPVCLSMAAFYLTGSADMTPDKIIPFALENGYYVSGVGSSWTLISEGGVKLGLQVTELPLVEGWIYDHLKEGRPIICAMGPGDFTATGHFIVLTGYEDGLLRINDPNSIQNSEKLWSYAEICLQIKNLWVISA